MCNDVQVKREASAITMIPRCLLHFFGDPVMAAVKAPHMAFNQENDLPFGHVGFFQLLAC